MTDLGFRANLDGYLDASLDLMRHVGSRTAAMLAETRDRLTSVQEPAQISALQEEIRRGVLAGIGGLPEPETEPSPGSASLQWRGGQNLSTHRVDRVVLSSLSSVSVPATLYRPLPALSDPGPAVLFVCGHTAEGKADPEYQAVCARLAAAGLVVLAIDPWGQGERLGYLDADGSPLVPGGTAEHTYAGLQSWWLGQSTVRWFLHDARRGLDALSELPEVDPARIGLTGNSGGGMLCTLLGAIEPRVAAVAVATYVSSREAIWGTGKHQDAEQVLLGGTRSGVDHAELLAAVAPRPLAVLAADFDFFPIEGTLDAVERAGHVYRLLEVPERLRLVRAPVTHSYAAALAGAAEEFFVEELEARGRSTGGEDPRLLPPEDLRCTRSGQVALDDPSARFLHDLHLAELDRLDQHEGPTPEQAARWVREQVQRDRRIPEHGHARWLPGPEGSLHGIWHSEVDLWGAGVLLPPEAHGRTGDRALRIVLPTGGTTGLASDHPLLQGVGPGEARLVLDVRGTGALTPHDKDGRTPEHQASSTYKLLCDLLWLGDSLVAGRAFDVTRAIDVLLGDKTGPPGAEGLTARTPVHLHAEGGSTLPAVLAAVVDERITAVHVGDGLGQLEKQLRSRLHDDGQGRWQAVLPGLPRHGPLTALRDHLGARLVLTPPR